MQVKERGAAMLAAILFLLVASGIITLLFTSTLSEIRQTGDSVSIVQSLTLARGGANLGGRLLQSTLRNDLQVATLKHADPVEVFPFGRGATIDSPNPTPSSVISDLKPVTRDLQIKADTHLCGNSKTLNPSQNQKVSLRVYFTDTACGDPLPSGVKLPGARYVSGSVRTYSVPFVLVSDASVGSYNRRIASQGEYQFTLGGGKFSQFALFTDNHKAPAPDNAEIWFTDRTLFDGPVHTNSTFKFHGEPWFGSTITSAGCKTISSGSCTSYEPGADFFSHDFVDAANLGSNPVYNSDKPQLTGGADWNASYVELPTGSDEGVDRPDLAVKNGISVGNDLYSLTMYAADNSGNPLSKDSSGDWVPKATYQYIKTCDTSPSDCELYRYGADKKLEKATASFDLFGVATVTAWTEDKSGFNGLIHIKGKVDRFEGPERVPTNSDDPKDAPPALASFAQITVVPEADSRITGDITYENPPCAGTPKRVDGTVESVTCDDLEADNVLGVFSPTGNILIGNENQATDASLNAPKNVAIHASLMASQGVVTVENFREGTPKGAVNLLGGIIEKDYGPFGTFDGGTGTFLTGFGRSFTFDQRMGKGFSPPYFPGTSPSTVEKVFIYSFGQREQAF